MITGPNLVKSGLVLYLDALNIKSYPSTGTTCYDLSGNVNHGTLTNGPIYDYSDNSITFDGSNDYISLNSAIDYSLSQSWSVEMYLKFNTGCATYWSALFGGVPTTDGGGYWLIHGGVFTYYHSYTPNVRLTYYNIYLGTQIPYDVFNHLVIVFIPTATPDTTGSYYIYINGILSDYSILTWDTGHSLSGRIKNVAADDGGVRFGQFDLSSFKVYNRNLTVSEIFQNYLSYKTRCKFEATGGNITISNGYKIHTFTTGGTFITNTGGNIELLIVAGGGGSGGGGWSGYASGAGGGGGVIYKRKYTVSGSYSVTIGDSGAAGIQVGDAGYRGGNGGNSIFDSLTAIGGGGGAGNYGQPGADGGSGGGGATYTGAGGSGTINQGYAGGSASSSCCAGGGGGGAGGVGGNAPNGSYGGDGGPGLGYTISGSLIYYGGGGTARGSSGSGTVNNGSTAIETAGAANTGAGGGGTQSTGGRLGGTGVVIIRYLI
jgi:hypothetical protein